MVHPKGKPHKCVHCGRTIWSKSDQCRDCYAYRLANQRRPLRYKERDVALQGGHWESDNGGIQRWVWDR